MKNPKPMTRAQKILLSTVKARKEIRVKDVTPDHFNLVNHGQIEIQAGERGTFLRYCGDET